MRRKDDSLEKLIVQEKLEGKKPRGRSPTCYFHQISKNICVTIQDISQDQHLVQHSEYRKDFINEN